MVKYNPECLTEYLTEQVQVRKEAAEAEQAELERIAEEERVAEEAKVEEDRLAKEKADKILADAEAEK